MTILVLDDDSKFREPLVGEIAEAGYGVLEAARISEADAALSATDVDLMIVDGLLPDGNGIDWIRARRHRMDATPIIFVSAFWKDMETFRILKEELGVQEVLHKPVDAATILRRVANLLGAPPPKKTPAKSAKSTIDIDLDELETIEPEPKPEPAQPTATPLTKKTINLSLEEFQALIVSDGEGEDGFASAAAVAPDPVDSVAHPVKNSPAPPRTDGRGAVSQKVAEVELGRAKDEYTRNLGDELTKLGKLVTLARNSDGAVTDIKAVRVLAHKLRGTVRWFGYEDIGDLVSEIERQMSDVIDGKMSRHRISWRQLETSIRQARKKIISAA